MQHSQRPEEGVGVPGTRLRDSCEPPPGCWEPDLSTPENQPLSRFSSPWWLVLTVNTTKLRVTREVSNCPDQTGLWTCLRGVLLNILIDSRRPSLQVSATTAGVGDLPGLCENTPNCYVFICIYLSFIDLFLH